MMPMNLKDRKRRFIPGVCNHIYQKTVNGYLIFYDREDYLVFYMILSVMAKRHNVSVLKICFMVDHVHLLIEAPSRESMASFIRDYSSVFVHEYNVSVGRSGQMFHKSYGSAPKKGDKKMRSAIVYIGNNPVEKNLCLHAEDYRWNFLKYLTEPYPFSKVIPLSECSRALRRCIKIVRSALKAGAYINHIRLREMFEGLHEYEKEYLTDYIITSYDLIDKDRLMKYYDNWNQMVSAMHFTAGSEHDIKEEYGHGSDQIYLDMIRYLTERGFKPVRSVTVLPLNQKLVLARELRQHTCASSYEMKKLLHL